MRTSRQNQGKMQNQNRQNREQNPLPPLVSSFKVSLTNCHCTSVHNGCVKVKGGDGLDPSSFTFVRTHRNLNPFKPPHHCSQLSRNLI